MRQLFCKYTYVLCSRPSIKLQANNIRICFIQHLYLGPALFLVILIFIPVLQSINQKFLLLMYLVVALISSNKGTLMNFEVSRAPYYMCATTNESLTSLSGTDKKQR